MRRQIFIYLLLTALASAATAQSDCPCFPDSEIWVVKACETWNCAAATMNLANGSPTMSFPTASSDFKWLVVRRVKSGSYVEFPEPPFQIETFDGMTSAAAKFETMSQDLQPSLFTAPDGKVLLISRRQPEARPRAAGH